MMTSNITYVVYVKVKDDFNEWSEKAKTTLVIKKTSVKSKKDAMRELKKNKVSKDASANDVAS